MNNISTLKRKTGTKDILLVGFRKSLFDYLIPPPSTDRSFYRTEDIENPFLAYQWLEKSLVYGELPYAIICHLNELELNEFRFLKQVRKHPILRNLPFIVIGEKGAVIDQKELLKEGVDDCYLDKVSWADLHLRVSFLKKHKQGMLLHEDLNIESNEFIIPRGKRIFDIAFASMVIAALSPLLLMIALLIKISSKGPVIYRSKRVGTGYQVFDFLKFRSMCQDADEKLNKLSHLNQYAQEDGQQAETAFIKLKNDPRITRIGRFIRMTSLDELPQLFNVLRGEMSIVGNRPLPLYEAELMTRDQWAQRFWAPAGLTGLWQTIGARKDKLTTEERVQLDIEYANKFSFVMDAKILSRTLPAMFQKEE